MIRYIRYRGLMYEVTAIGAAGPTPQRLRDQKAQRKKEPVFEFGNPRAINEFQHSYEPSQLDQFGGDFKFRSGHSYGNLPFRLKLYREKYGEPDIVHVISNPPGTVHAVFFEQGLDMIQIWDRGNILSEFQWKSFERQAHQAGYKIQHFRQGKVADSHGYWLQAAVVAELPKLKLTDRDLDKMGLIKVDGQVMTLEEFGSLKELRVRGDLNLSGTRITKLPNNLHVGGSLNLLYARITRLPENMHVGGWLSLWGTRITRLPENLRVGGYLNLHGTPITRLPENMHVGGYLNLSYTPITKLPKNLHVGGFLYLQGTPITELPNNLHVGGEIYCKKGQLKDVPKKFKKKLRME